MANKKHPKILLVEDVKFDADLFLGLVRPVAARHGFLVEWVVEAGDAIDEIDNYAGVILDCHLPDIHHTKGVKTFLLLAACPVMLYSGQVDDELLEIANQAGAPCVSKDDSPAEISRAFEDFLKVIEANNG